MRAHLTQAKINLALIEELILTIGIWGCYAVKDKSWKKQEAYSYWKALHRDQTAHSGETNQQVLESYSISLESHKILEKILNDEENLYFKVPFGQFTFDHEGNEGGPYHSRVPHLPLNSASGVTIGRGYDVGNRTKYQVIQHLTEAGADPTLIEEMAEAAGKGGIV